MAIKMINNDKARREDAEYRSFDFEIRAAKTDDDQEELYVEGRAITFNDPTVIWEYDGIQYKEQIDDRALDDADMSDVIFNYNHGGKVMARTRNNTLELTRDKKGLNVKARLDGTEEGRKLYEEVKGGYIDRMSFRFVASENAYDSDNHMRTIRKIKKLYDVSAVDIPAYDKTSISARSFFEAEAEEERKAAEAAELRRKLLLRTFL
ncbi:MAG: HK97 family phage prohead protease [Desulfotomaculaceae bacterium]|nr:HK97 family phage prohead protease [Desulfotomaculaceae bacterium]